MSFPPGSLQQKFVLFLIIPVTLLLVVMGALGFFYARNLLLDQWREASILKLQRASHEMDMRIERIKEWVRIFHESPRKQDSDELAALAIDHLRQQQGVAEVKLNWSSNAAGNDIEWEGGHDIPVRAQGMRRKMGAGMHRFHSARVRDVTPPQFDEKGEHGTISLLSDLNDRSGKPIGQLEVVVDFDFIFSHVVESGWWQSSKAFLVGPNGQILVCTLHGRRGKFGDSGDPLELKTLEAMASASFGTVFGQGHPPDEVSGFFRLQEASWTLVMIAPGREILAPISGFRLHYLVFVVGVIVIIIVLIRMVTFSATASIRRVSRAAIRLSKGEFSAPLPVKSRDEVGELTRSFNAMMGQLEERLRLKEAMNLAKEVQQNLLPVMPPSIPGLDIAGRSLYCQETGGDYFDYIPVQDARGRGLCVAVGDVVGHGISAALLMTTVRALLRCRLDQPGPLAGVVSDVNRLLCRDTSSSGSFVTLFLLQVDLPSMALEWVRAGHDPAVYFNASGNSLTYLDGPGAALGVEEGMDYQSGSLAGPAPGDIILIGTDGIWETPGEALTPFGKERVEAVVRRRHRDTAATILEAVLGELAAFRGKKRQEDDITLVVVKVGDTD